MTRPPPQLATMRILLILLILSASQSVPAYRILLAEPSSSSSSSGGRSLDPSATAVTIDGKWDHNYSCIFDTGKAFTYLHIAYVTYFNITYKAPTYCSPADCLDSCTNDCSCSAVVFDSPTSSCYQYHDYIPVQSIPFVPVRSRDTITAYIKVQNGYSSAAVAAAIPPGSAAILGFLSFWVVLTLNWVLW